MNIHIQQSTLLVKKLLCQYKIWTVHSIYRKTVNLQADNCLIAMQSANTPLSPISLITNLEAAPFAGLPFVIAQKISSDVFDLTSAQLLDTKLTPAPETIHSMKPIIKQIIQNSPANGFNLIFSKSPLVDRDFLLTAASARISNIEASINEQNWMGASQGLASLIGLGIGLTPSGDDFLCGFMAGMILAGKTDHPLYRKLRQTIQSSIDRTNPISQAFLNCACQEQFSQAVCNIKNSPSYDRLFRDINSIGHSSGVDSLCGILLAQSVL